MSRWRRSASSNEEGSPPAEARRRALVAFGGLDAHREAMRDGRGARWFDDLGADVRYALRAMRRAPGFALAVALTLGVGIGVNGIVFGYVDSLLFRRVPARDADALVSMFTIDSKTKQIGQVVVRGLSTTSARPEWRVRWPRRHGRHSAERRRARDAPNVADMVWGELVTENFFTVLGMTPAIGRFFTADDAPQGANPFAVLSHDGWMRRFGGDSSIVGRHIRVNGTVFTVVGVAPRGFRGMRTFGFWPEILGACRNARRRVAGFSEPAPRAGRWVDDDRRTHAPGRGPRTNRNRRATIRQAARAGLSREQRHDRRHAHSRRQRASTIRLS